MKEMCGVSLFLKRFPVFAAMEIWSACLKKTDWKLWLGFKRWNPTRANKHKKERKRKHCFYLVRVNVLMFTAWDDADELHLFYSDKFQEYKQKHQELKAAVAKELGFKLPNTEAMDGGEKKSDQETGCGKEGEDEVNPTTAESLVDGGAVVVANGSAVEAAEQSQAEGSDRARSEGNMVNGVHEVKVAGKDSLAEASIATNVLEVQAGSGEENGKTNGALDSPTSPSAHKGKGTWADIVSNAGLANGTGDKVKKAGHITAHRVAEVKKE